MNTTLRLAQDRHLDANGFITLRPFNGQDDGDTDAQPIATVFSESDAAHIVKCVNSHDAAREALNLAEHYMRVGRTSDNADGYADALERIREALKLVRGGA